MDFLVNGCFQGQRGLLRSIIVIKKKNNKIEKNVKSKGQIQQHSAFDNGSEEADVTVMSSGFISACT